MRKINSVQRRLEWVQPGALKMYYELRSDNELIATLGFRSLLGSFATAESADGCWTFKRIVQKQNPERPWRAVSRR